MSKEKIIFTTQKPNNQDEDSLLDIIKLATPEICSAALLVFLPIVFDLYFVSCLKNNLSYKALGLSNNITHLLLKMTEALAIATSTQTGIFNGAKNYGLAGNGLLTSLAAAFILGSLQIVFIYTSSTFYCLWMGASPELTIKAQSFMVTQSFAMFFAFFFMCLAGFLKGTKNSFIPMCAHFFSVLLFLIFDYILILGKFGFPTLGLQGSAIAAVIRYLSASIFLIVYIIYSKKEFPYFQNLSWKINIFEVFNLIKFTVPIIVDKSIIGFAYIWLYKMIMPISAYSLLAMEVIKNIERLSFIPATGLAQATNFILSNNIGEKNYSKAWKNLIKILNISICLVSLVLLFVCVYAEKIVSIFDPQSLFKNEASFVLRYVSILVIFDVCQVIFASALRTTGYIYTVMFTRIGFFSCLYLPFSLILSKTLTTTSVTSKFLYFYGSFYLTISFIGLVYLRKIKQALTTHNYQDTQVNVSSSEIKQPDLST